MSRHSPECSGSIAMICCGDEIDYGFVHENQTVSAERGGRAQIAFPDPAGGAGQNWRADRILDDAVNIRCGSPDYGPP